MNISIYHTPDDHWVDLRRDLKVFTPYSNDKGGVFESLGWQYADECFTKESECRRHFWFGSMAECVAAEGTLGEYLDRMMKRRGMNAFYELRKLHVLTRFAHLLPKEPTHGKAD